MAISSRGEMGVGGGSRGGFGGGGAIAGKKSGRTAKVTSTGKSKAKEAKESSTKKYEQPVKGSGKPKYQNVIKEARVDTKKPRKEEIFTVSSFMKPIGVKPSKQEVTRKAGKSPNIAKQIDRENKETKGQRTQKTTKKVPVKKVK